MYRLSNDRTEWYGSTTPLVIVSVDKRGREKEDKILFTSLTKKLGEPFLERISVFLNNEELLLRFYENKEELIGFLEKIEEEKQNKK